MLADLYNPQYSGWEGVSADSAWGHLLAAVACDPADGNPYFPLFNESLRRGDSTRARQALTRMVEVGFLTGPHLQLATWILTSAPQNAVLLAAGDMDTYPLLAVQTVRGQRQDVTVVNIPMLSLPWYARRIAAAAGLPLPIPDSALGDSPASGVGAPELSDLLVRFWRAGAAKGRWARPLRFSITTGSPGEGEGYVRLSGPLYEIVPSKDQAIFDRDGTVRALRDLRGADWIGPRLSPMDRSPVRRAMVAHMGHIPLYLANRVGVTYAAQHRMVDARLWLEWGRRFASDARLEPDAAEEILRPLADKLHATDE